MELFKSDEGVFFFPFLFGENRKAVFQNYRNYCIDPESEDVAFRKVLTHKGLLN